MKIKCLIINEQSEKPWEEELDIVSLETAEKDIQVILDNFNSSLRPFETKRRLVKIITDSLQKRNSLHDIEKKNLVTLSDSIGMYDIYRCKKCGMERKSYGISAYPYKNFPKRCYPLKRLAKNGIS